MTAAVDEQQLVITQPGVYDNIPAADYHRDPVPGGSLSSTGARRLLEPGGPAKYRYALDHPGEEITDAFDFGKAAHQVVLGDPEDRLVVLPNEWRTKEVKEQVAAARAAGKTPVREKQMETVQLMAAAINDHPTAAGLLHSASGKPEQTLVWQDQATGVMCRARIDWLRTTVAGRRLLVVDYKSAEHADTEAFGKSAADYGYMTQAGFYNGGVRALGLDDDPAFLFIAQDKKPPYLVNVIELDDTAMHLGQTFARHATQIYADCKRTGVWPGYGTEVQLASLPAWYLRQFGEA